LLKKKLAIGVIVLFLGISVIPSVVGDNSSFENIIYVDGDNTEGPWYGTEYHPYQYIQDGVDAAGNGDTVFVYSRIYYEHIVINTSISLVGEYREIPIIDGNNTGDVLVINANNTTIRDFTIQNCSKHYLNPGNVVKILSNNNTILNNNINTNDAGDWKHYHSSGIQLINSNYNIISDNIFSSNGCSIDLESSSYNKIKNNIVIKSRFGIGGTSSSNNIISNNQCVDITYGINFYRGKYNEISNNTILNSTIAIETYGNDNIINNTISSFWIGIRVLTGNNIIGNKIDSGMQMGILVEGNKNNITGNKIDSVGYIGALESPGGIFIVESFENIVKRNTISNCKWGITLFFSLENKFIENNILSNNDIGCIFSAPINNKIWLEHIGEKYEPNYWNANYWGRYIVFRKTIFGFYQLSMMPYDLGYGHLFSIPIPGIAYDDNPAKEPYDIP